VNSPPAFLKRRAKVYSASALTNETHYMTTLKGIL